MDQAQLMEKLRVFMQHYRLKNRDIESYLGMPENCLSNFLSLKKTLPGKWVKPIINFCEGKKTEIKLGDLAKMVTTADKIHLLPHNTPQPGWIKDIKDFCANEGILPADLINAYLSEKKSRMRPKMPIEIEKKESTSLSKSEPIDKYNPNDNPIYRKKMNL